MAIIHRPGGNTGAPHPVTEGPTPLTTLAQYITLVHQIKREVQDPRPSLVGNYNTIVEIRDLIANFEKVG